MEFLLCLIGHVALFLREPQGCGESYSVGTIMVSTVAISRPRLPVGI